MDKRIIFLKIILVCSYLFLFISLFRVMIIDSDKYKELLKEASYDNVLGSSTPRGRILDRNYNVIVDKKKGVIIW